jgi:hypothetical protein
MLGEFQINLLSKIVYYVISSTYIIKEIEKLVLCVYRAIMHSVNPGRMRENTRPCVVHASLVFSQHSPRATSRHKRMRLVLYFLNNVSI